jgi:hypothetical protein
MSACFNENVVYVHCNLKFFILVILPHQLALSEKINRAIDSVKVLFLKARLPHDWPNPEPKICDF